MLLEKIIFLNSSHFCTVSAPEKPLDPDATTFQELTQCKSARNPKKLFFVSSIERSSNPGRFALNIKVNLHGKTQCLIHFLEEGNLTSKRAMFFQQDLRSGRLWRDSALIESTI